MRAHIRPPCGRLMRQFLGAWFAPEPYDVAIEPHQELWAEHIKEYSDEYGAPPSPGGLIDTRTGAELTALAERWGLKR